MKVYLLLVLILCTKCCSAHGCYHKESIYGCNKVTLPQKEKLGCFCANQRYEAIQKERQWWRLTKPKNPGEPNPQNELLLPQLDQPQRNIAAKALFDPLDKGWFSLYYTAIKVINETQIRLAKAGFLQKPMTSYIEYKQIYGALKAGLKSLPAPGYYDFPTDSQHFTDIVTRDMWQEDKYFTQRRLAGTCPHFLRKVVLKGSNGMKFKTLRSYLNRKFNWDHQISITVNEYISLQEAATEGRLFVLHHEEYFEIPEVLDILDINPFDDHKLFENVSPIALFVLNHEKELKVVAIQKHYTSESEVVTPNQEDPVLKKQWLLAKGFVDIVDMVICQVKCHLLDTHLTQENFCNLFRRHLGTRHPLYDLIESHCEGTTPVGALGITSLIDENRFLHKLFHIGHTGTRMLINNFYQKQHYDDIDFPMLLKKRGLDDVEQFRYYPYLEDGKEVWDDIVKFANKFVDMYYKNDRSIVEDWELQGFVNEVSADGDAPNGAKYKGFPNKFSTTKDLKTFLTRFIWLPVQHAVNSAPLMPNGAYVPIAPTKIYFDPRPEAKTNYAYNLPNATATMTQTALTIILSSIRVNRLFDYSKRMSDQKARCLVQDTYSRLHKCTQDILEARNKKRFENGDLTYQYLEPKWLANSIHN